MKKVIFIALIALLLIGCAEGQTPKGGPTVLRMRMSNFAEWAQPTVGLDTLYLIKSEPVTDYLVTLWKSDTTVSPKPIICMIDVEEMKKIKTRINGEIEQDTK